MQAERRAGEMLIEMAEKGERDNGKGNRNAVLKSQAGTPKLADLGITRSQSSRWQLLAKLSVEEFEKALEGRLSKVLSVLERSANPNGPKPEFGTKSAQHRSAFSRRSLFSLRPDLLA
jgi:hypothetical protein